MSNDNEENGGGRRPLGDSPSRRKDATGGRRVERDRPGRFPAKLGPRHKDQTRRDRHGGGKDGAPTSTRAGTSPRQDDRGQDATPATPNEAGERISKVVSRAGIASRRDVERMIGEGRIALNGETVTTPVIIVKPSDRIAVDGVALPMKERTRLFLYHKPVGLVTTEKDPEGRETVFAALPAGLPRLVSIGRLDLNTEGLLLLTNDGGLARVLAHPTTGWLRRYRVRAFGEITQDQLDGLKQGIEIDGMHYGPVEAHVDREQGSNMWLTLGLREGKNREVKRILEHFGLKVNRLIRISFGPFQLGELAPGAVEEVRTRTLKDQLGPELAREAHVDFASETQGGPSHEPELRRRSAFGERHRETRDRASLERPPHKSGGTDEARALRKAEAIAQGRRSAAHRHSWRDEESWAARGGRKGGAPAGAAKRQHRAPHGGAAKPDDRRHLRGGRIADRKGRSVLVERIVRDPAAASHGARRDGARGEERQNAHRPSPPRDTDVLRRKTRREQGSAGPQRDELRAGRRTGESRSETWKARGGRGSIPRPDRRSGEELPPWRGGRDRRPGREGEREGERPWRRREEGGATPRGEAPKPRGERPGGFKPRGERPQGFKPRGERPEGFKPRSERPEGFKPRGERTEGFKPRRERPDGFKPRGERTGDFKLRRERPEGFKPRGERSQGFKPRGERPDGFKPRRERTEAFKPRREGVEGSRPRDFGRRPGDSRSGPPRPDRPPRKPPG